MTKDHCFFHYAYKEKYFEFMLQQPGVLQFVKLHH